MGSSSKLHRQHKKDKRQALRMLELVGVHYKCERYPAGYSMGERLWIQEGYIRFQYTASWLRHNWKP